jgi:hypothetical protein
MREQDIERAVRGIFAESGMHAKRILSLTHAVVGVAHAAQAGVASIGRALATVRGLSPKHAIKQFDRFLSNSEIDLNLAWISYLGFVIGNRSELVVSLDWTDYADGTQHRIALSLVTRHGRATPLIWKTVTSKEQRTRGRAPADIQMAAARLRRAGHRPRGSRLRRRGSPRSLSPSPREVLTTRSV